MRSSSPPTATDWSSSLTRSVVIVARFGSTDGDDPQERLVTNSALMDALDELPHGQRAVIVLRYGSQLSEAETAAALGITTGTVKSQTARALVRMREVLTAAEPTTYEMEIA